MSLLGTRRGVGITELLHGFVTWPVVVLFGLVTQLGDVWFLFLVGGVLYVTGDELPRWGIARRQGLFVLALVLVYVALIGALKHLFVLPRPPGAGVPPELQGMPATLRVVFADMTTAEGPGFPSGHALGTTMVWGGLALVLDRGTPRLRFGVAGTVVVLVSLSRLVLGVHYLVDVVVGTALGAAVLGVLYWLSDRGTDPERVLLVAVAAGLVGVALGTTFDSVVAIGSATGAWLVWRGVADATPAHPTKRSEVVAGFVVLGIMGGLFGVVYAFKFSYSLAFLGTAVAAGGATGAPLLGERLA
jgi:membrane-associated phospholipid phosphatase